jgi:hypothetical protein
MPLRLKLNSKPTKILSLWLHIDTTQCSASTHDGIYATATSILSFIDLRSFINKIKLASMTVQLNTETASGTNLLQRAQYAIQKKWLSQKLGHVECIFNPGKSSNCMFTCFTDSRGYPTYLGYFGAGVPKANTSYISMLMVLQHPFSRGSVVGTSLRYNNGVHSIAVDLI